MVITKVTDEQQLDIVVELANIIWNEYFTPIIGKAQVDYMLNKYQSKQSITEQITNSFVYFLLLEKGVPIGYVSIIIKQKELFLSKFYIVADERNKGFGRQLINFLIKYAIKYDAQKISLTVNKYNIDSINAYQKMGFINIRSVIQNIGGGFVMDDYQMELINL